jgi:hypothetical protein
MVLVVILLISRRTSRTANSAPDDISLDDTSLPLAIPQSSNLPLIQPHSLPNFQRHTEHPPKTFDSSSDLTNNYKAHINAYQSHDPSDNTEHRPEDHSHHEISSPRLSMTNTAHNITQQPFINSLVTHQMTSHMWGWIKRPTCPTCPTILVSDDDVDQSDLEYPLGPPISSLSPSIPSDSIVLNHHV